jgi:DNA-binding transcriptional ArsR family regulator
MREEMLEGEHLKDSYILLHPERYRILELLAEKPMHINELSRALSQERRLVAYHLMTLEERGFFTPSSA